jgi:hypothetical protein
MTIRSARRALAVCLLALATTATSAHARRLNGTLGIDGASITFRVKGPYRDRGSFDELIGRIRCPDARCPVRRGVFIGRISSVLLGGGGSFKNRRDRCTWGANIPSAFAPELIGVFHCDSGISGAFRLQRP